MCALHMYTGGWDVDCGGNFNNLYCDDIRDDDNIPIPLKWSSGHQCEATEKGASCKSSLVSDSDSEELVCPQLPPSSPKQLANGYTHKNVPREWTCDPALYYELESDVIDFSCDCGCGVIDPGQVLKELLKS